MLVIASMGNKMALYADVVTDESPIVKSSADENPHAVFARRAQKLREDPYITESERKSIDSDSKEKQERTDMKPETKSEETQKEVEVLVSRSKNVLFQARSIFPFDFFPSTITIDANKVNIIIKTFFATETATSVHLKEIMDVRVESTLFLGKLIIDYGPHPLKIRTVYVPALKKTSALKAKEIIEGMLVLYRAENIDTTTLNPEDTMEDVKEIGKIEERE